MFSLIKYISYDLYLNYPVRQPANKLKGRGSNKKNVQIEYKLH